VGEGHTTKKREELQRTEEGIEKRAETRPRRNTGYHMRRNHVFCKEQEVMLLAHMKRKK